MAVTSFTAKDGGGSNVTVYTNSDPSTGGKQDTGNTSLATLAGVVKTEDAATANGNSLVMIGVRQTATPGDTAGDLDAVHLQVSGGALWTRPLSTVATPAGTNIIGKVGIDQTTPGTTNLVALTSQGYGGTAVTFTPAASSHVANDCNGAAQNFTNMGPSGGKIMITSASLEIDGATVEATAWRLYLYNVTPPSAYADDAAWDLGSGDRASFLGFIELGTAVDMGSTQWVEVNGINKQVQLSGTDLFGYLVNLTTLTPANVAHKVMLHSVSV